jgi:hypothetical protein
VAKGFFTPLADHSHRAMAGLSDRDLAAAHRTFAAVLEAMLAFQREVDG